MTAIIRTDTDEKAALTLGHKILAGGIGVVWRIEGNYSYTSAVVVNGRGFSQSLSSLSEQPRDFIDIGMSLTITM